MEAVYLGFRTPISNLEMMNSYAMTIPSIASPGLRERPFNPFKSANYTDIHPPQYSVQSTTQPNYSVSLETRHPTRKEGEGTRSRNGGGEEAPHHDKSISNDITHAKSQCRKRIMMNQVFQNKHRDRPRKTTCHKSESDKENDTGFPCDAIAGVGIGISR